MLALGMETVDNTKRTHVFTDIRLTVVPLVGEYRTHCGQGRVFVTWNLKLHFITNIWNKFLNSPSLANLLTDKTDNYSWESTHRPVLAGVAAWCSLFDRGCSGDIGGPCELTGHRLQVCHVLRRLQYRTLSNYINWL